MYIHYILNQIYITIIEKYIIIIMLYHICLNHPKIYHTIKLYKNNQNEIQKITNHFEYSRIYFINIHNLINYYVYLYFIIKEICYIP